MSFQPTTTTQQANNAEENQQLKPQKQLWVTHVNSVGPYLQICGQTNPMTELAKHLEKNVLPKCKHLYNSWSIDEKKKHLSEHKIFLVKTINRMTLKSDDELLRARIIRFVETKPPHSVLLVEVEFIDMGYTKIIQCEELLIAPQNDEMMTMQPLGSQYILAGIFHEWSPVELDNVFRLIANQAVSITVEMEVEGHKFIKMLWKDWDMSEFLFSQRKIGSPINRDFQRNNFLRLLKEQESQEQQFANNISAANYNENNNTSNKNNNINGGSHSINSRPGGSHSGQNSNETTILKNQLLQKERLLAIQNEQRKGQLYQQYLQHPQAFQNVMLPSQPMVPSMPQNIGNSMQNYMLGLRAMNRLPATQLYGIPNVAQSPLYSQYQPRPVQLVTAPTALRVQRPFVSAIDINNVPNTNQVNNITNNSKAISKSLPNTGYKINKFVTGETYDVCVSFVEKGPYHFSVQLNDAQLKLTEMMNAIERIDLKNIKDEPTIGMACIARYSEDNHMYRAVIVNAQQQNSIQVIYVDYGNSAFVKRKDLYEIPIQFLEERAFALPFSLAGLKTLGPIDDSLKKTFKEMVVYQMCKLKVTPPEGPPVVQYCELYLQQKDMLKVLQDIQKSRSVYPKESQLSSNDIVEIRFIDSPRNFYVQKVSNINEFNKLMDDMDKYYNTNQVVPLRVIVGAAYAVKNDSEWYRAEVIRSDEMAIIVRFVDFGYERIVTKNLLSNISDKHLKMPRQAVHCCLKGFESNELGNKDIATTQFEMLAEESQGRRRAFTVKVFRIHIDDLHIVNLFTKELNVMKKLYKLSMPFEQYLTLEKSDFQINGHGNNKGGKLKDENTKTLSTNSSNIGDDHSSQFGKKSVKSSEMNIKAAPFMPQSQRQQQQQQQQQQQPQQLAVQQMKQQQYQLQTQQKQQQQQQQQQLQQQILLKQQLSPKSTPAQRLQQYTNKNHHNNNNNNYKGGANEWDNNSSASSNMSKQQQRNFGGSQQQSHGRKTQQQQHPEMLNNSFESNDRRSDASTNSNRSRKNNNNARQKDRRHNKDLDISRQSNASTRSSKKSSHQPQERSQNAPQGYSQSRRGSMDSQYGIPSATSSQFMSPPMNAAAAAAALLTSKQIEEYMPLDHEFPIQAIKTPITEDITISWWVSPHEFYTHLKKRAAGFDELMREIQKFYHKKPLQQLQLKTGSYVIARHRKDRTYYRASIIACNPMLRKYKVFFVDYGNQYTVSSEDIWQVERRFAIFPVMAYYCSFKNIVSNFDHLHIIDRIEKYLPTGNILSCEYKEAIQSVYYVNVKVNNTSLLERLKNDKIVTEISPDFRLELLAGQQIRAKIISVKNMLNFKIIFEGCDVPLLCSYDDVRFVKSNPDYGQKFKIAYEGKSCVVNIKSVNTHKVILLRPLLALFKEDIPSLICCSPRILQTFKASLVHITDIYRIYVHNNIAAERFKKLLDEMFSYYESNGSPLSSYEADQVCAVKSAFDKNWYRARIIRPSNRKNQNTSRKSNTVEVYLLDHGSTETLAKDQLKVLEKRFFIEQNALAIEINLPILLINDKKSNSNESNKTAIDELYKKLDNQQLTIKALECRRNHLIGEIINEKGENIVDHLLSKKMIKSRDFEQMAKQLEKDNSNMLEFIETVDLTLEDEEIKTINKSAANSPQKVKNKKTEKVEKIEKTDKIEKIEKEEIIEKPKVMEIKIQETTTPQKVEKIEKVIEPIEVIIPKEIPLILETPKPLETSTPIPELLTPKEELSISAQDSPIPPSTPFDYSDMEAAVFSHCDTPAQFFIHAYDKINQLHKLQENLQIVASSLPPLMNVYNGAHCISLYSVDKQWYRAEIIDAELLVLKFIDFGNTDCLTDTTDIKEMSVFPDIEPLCMLCALPIRPNGTADWVDAANAIFNESYEKTLYYTYILQSDDAKKPSYINLIIDGVNVANKLIDDGFAKPLEWVETGENCYISHVNNISDFYIQYEKDSKALELIEFHLENYGQFPKLTSFNKNQIVAALFHDDEKWYRAQLLRDLTTTSKEGGFEVLFIDYGNTAITHECREISTELANLPILSKKCALELNSEVYFGWSDAAESKFAEIAGCGDTIFNVELRTPSAECAIVYLFIDTLNINTELEPLCLKRAPPAVVEKPASDLGLNNSFGGQSVATIDPNDISQLHNGIIAHLNGPESFYVQFEKDSARLEDLVTALNAWVGMDVAKNPYELGKLYAAIFDDDQQLYRAKLLSINEPDKNFNVLFVDYGNEAVVKELRILPPDLEQVRQIAKHCALNQFETLIEIGNDAIQRFNDLVNGVDGVVKLEFATGEQAKNERFKVNLYLIATEENILEKIKQEFDEKLLENEIINKPQECLIPHYITPKEFYIQLQTKIPKMEKITQALAKDKVLAQMPKVAMVPALNQIYAVFAEEDDLYYRGLVTSKSQSVTNTNAYDVQLIDYGNIIIVDELRELPMELKNEPPIAKLCQLGGLENQVDDNENKNSLIEHFATLMDAHFGERFEVEFLDFKTTPAIVQLKINGENVLDKLNEALKTGISPKIQIEPTLYDCAIVQINDTNSFYLQLLKDTNEIENITEILLDAEIEFAIFKELNVGALCAAQFPDDGVFYRARIIEIFENEENVEKNEKQVETKTKCLLHFIDFGNDAITTEFRILPENLCKPRRFSKHCALDMKFKIDTEAATQHFKTYIDEHYSETFQVEFIKEIDMENENNDLMPIPMPCRLFHQTKNVASEIERMLKEV